MQRKVHKRFSNPVDTVDPLPVDPFMVTTLDLANVDANKKLFYSWVDSQVVAELIKNILTDVEYSNMMLKRNMFTFQDDSTRNEKNDGPCLLKLLFDRIDPHIVVGVGVLCQKLDATNVILTKTMSMTCSRIWKNSTQILSTKKARANLSVNTCLMCFYLDLIPSSMISSNKSKMILIQV